MNEILDNAKTFILGLDPGKVHIAAFVLCLISTALMTWYFSILLKEQILERVGTKFLSVINSTVERNLRVTKWKYFNYDELRMYISKSGLGYMTKDKMTPVTYMGCRLLAGLLFMLVGGQGNWLLGLLLLPVGFVAVDLIINASDKSDNAKMLDDIKQIFDTLRIQTKAGVYITSVLMDCYLVVKHGRLKKAFLTLTSDLAAKNDPDESLEAFRNKFNNEYLDALVVIVKQSLVTGQSAKMFDDIKTQIIDIDRASIIAEEARIKAQIVFVQLLLYVAIIVVAIYIAVLGVQQIGL